MRKLLSVCAVLACLAAAGNAWAVIGWAGNVWPLNGASVVPTAPVDVYAQVWKGGVTDAAGQGAGIAAELRYTTDIAPMQTVAMTYNTDVGNNDEYTAQVPQAALVGATYVDVTVIFTDLTDMTTFEVTGDQQGTPPPLRYNVVNVLPVNVDVTFTMCMSGTPTSGAPCVIGGAAPIGNWGAGVSMNYVNTELWTVTVTFPAGSNPYFEYKYKADGCTNWEYVGNRGVTLPTDGTTAVSLAQDSFNNQPMGCTGQSLDADKILCIQVCLEGVENTGGVCVIGNRPELTGWTTGVPMTMIGANLYQACIVIPAGEPVPVSVEYKFKKDDCNTWEGVGNRTLTVDNASPAEQTLTSTWDNGPGTCAPVPANTESWGAIKKNYR